jgi:16S rRNA (uracil1498-N3)-methyltransferase
MKHLFAIYNKQLLVSENNKLASLCDRDANNRIVNILRLGEGDKLVIFDKTYFYELEISQITKREIKFTVLDNRKIMRCTPKIKLIIGLLKKDNFEKALHNAALLSVQSVQPVYTDLMHKNWWADRYLERFESIMAAACEQCKNFALPDILPPISLNEYLQNAPNNLMVCDPDGQPLAKANVKQSEYSIIIGPEAGFSENEISMLEKYAKYSLVNSVLTSYDAVFAAGIMINNYLN